MKKLFLGIPMILFLIITFSSCSEKKESKPIITEKIQYDVLINNNDPQLDWWVNNIEGSKREPLIKRIMEAANKGEVRVYDYFNNPLTPAQIHSIGTDTMYQVLKRNRPPYEEYDTMVVRQIENKDIVKLRFLEQWSWDPAKLEIDKKVLGICPIIIRKVGEQEFNQPLFWIYLDDYKPQKETIK